MIFHSLFSELGRECKWGFGDGGGGFKKMVTLRSERERVTLKD